LKEASSNLKNDIEKLDPELARVILPWILRHPRYFRAGPRLMRAVKKAKRARVAAGEKDLKVPPFLILSITSRCNLFCNGCFAAATGTINSKDNRTNIQKKNSLNYEQWRTIVSQASELGVMGFVIAGGEPFLFPDLLELCQEFKDRVFVILTNGTTLKSQDYKKLKRTTNIAILVSVEGGMELTDTRRGNGVYEKAMDALVQLNKIGVPNGISVTVTRMNYEYWLNSDNIDCVIDQGVRLGVFIEYIPLTPGNTYEGEGEKETNSWETKDDHALMLTKEERQKFRAQMMNYRTQKSIYIIHSPGDEEFFGGCVSAGRGFAHVTPQGDLTPCPISNVATHNLTASTLQDGLASPLFEEIRNNEHLLENEGTPCALFAHPKEVDELARAVGAYRTSI
jgi:MoaA/NifB/PqqE/SkfB family radical SAM enzyme